MSDSLAQPSNREACQYEHGPICATSSTIGLPPAGHRTAGVTSTSGPLVSVKAHSV
jgi:hypothetical protein